MKVLKQWLHRHAAACSCTFTAILIVTAASTLPVRGHPAEPYRISLSTEKLHTGDVAFLEASPARDIVFIRGSFQNRNLAFFKSADNGTLCAFVAVDLDDAPGDKPLQVTVAGSSGRETVTRLSVHVLEKKFPVQRLTLPESKVTLGKKSLERHQRERTAVRNVLAKISREKLWGTSFSRPVPGDISTPFGVRRILNSKPRSPHTGVDFRGAEGTPVAASGDGIVVFTGNHYFSGNSVYIDHGTGIVTMYFHLAAIHVTSGERVTRGRTIGLVGSTGRATGPHLHWGVRIDGQRVDPLSFLALFSR